ncbi:sporulation-specific protein SPO7 [Kluyveromyces marxianus]|uniref:Sporulation-specific protein SPO7 n=2 Tax=Kluyveromyces marxianus TaxID=4911 RepID=W0T5Z0_KLUMD|nr:sporulation-specific protein SPO7 [Kluyveromyces marxianus DMKU3-1042]QGN14543.1 sporulation-specific protein SPO7 [Kluyveromyces marxianus]BAO38805.1 sporulation-specific protein SPO7 [Kluyveromyces marxianus DMKU3-1042]BAP70345.1 sporulation-specific protein SPO7 [Kluyveromyces marxianus]
MMSSGGVSDEDSIKDLKLSITSTPVHGASSSSESVNDSPWARRGQAGSSATPTSNRRRRSSSRASSKNLKSSEISPISMIFRNLLILEDDLRNQSREQRMLKWQFTLFLAGLAGIAAFSFYELYFTSERVTGLYRVGLQFLLIFISVTIVLFHLSGEYKRTMVIPRRFLVNANKGMRQFNMKLVKVKSTWIQKYADTVRLVVRRVAKWNMKLLIMMGASNTSIYAFWSSLSIRCLPRLGAVDVKLVLNAKAFSAEIREGWEIYRDEFWKRETVRRRKQESQNNTHLKKE